MMMPCLSQAEDLESCRWTAWPGDKDVRESLERSWSNFALAWAASLEDAAEGKSMGTFCEGRDGRDVRCALPNISWAGLYPSERGTFRHSYSIVSASEPEDALLRKIFFTDFTPASAKPLLFGLYGVETSCEMAWLEQKRENSPRNWGPPSLLMEDGQQNRLNQEVRTLSIASDESDRRWWENGYPL